jgi:hypothetical protein
MFGEWYQKTNKTEDTNKLTLLAFKLIASLHNTRLATLIKLLETVSKASLGIDRRTAVTRSWIAAVRQSNYYYYAISSSNHSIVGAVTGQ